MPKMTKKYISLILSALVCFNNSFSVIQAEEETVLEEEPVVQEVLKEEQTKEKFEEEPVITEEAEEGSADTVDDESLEEGEDNESETIPDEAASKNETVVDPSEDEEETVLEEPAEGEKTGEEEAEGTEVSPEPETENTKEEPAEEISTVPEENQEEVAEKQKDREITVEEEEEGSEEYTLSPSGYEYTISNNEVTITGYKVNPTSAEIPSEIEGYPVTSIGKSAFVGCVRLVSIRIPDSVKTIANGAFSGCGSLTSITIPNSVTSIGDFAFSNCTSLTNITIPSSVTSIQYNPFTGCSNLASITVSSSNPVYDSRNNCNAIIKTSTNTLIGGCKNTIIPDSVTSIGSYVFNDITGLTDITIPDNVTSIGSSAFNGCSNLNNITIPSGVTRIGEFAFNHCSSFTSITIPNGVKSIEKCLFQSCSSLTSVTVPESITSIGDYAFSSCTSLTDITIPAGVTSIGDSAFKDCSNITSITLSDGLRSIGGQAFSGCSKLTAISIPKSITWISDLTFAFCSKLTSVTIPDSVTSIGRDAFYNCSNLTSVTISGSATRLTAPIFQNCSSLKTAGPLGSESDIEFGWTESIPAYAFSGCTGLTSITIPADTKKIGSNAFDGCTHLKQVNYFGSSDDWSQITIGNGNEQLTSASRTCIVLPESISFINSTLDLAVGDSQNVTISAVPSNTSVEYFEWTSSDPSVCTVSSTGIVTGVSEGTATITARNTYNDVQASFVVSTYIAHPESIVISVPNNVMGVGESQQLGIAFNPANSYDKSVIWSSSDDSIASVDAEGNVTGYAPGTVTITAESADGGKTDTADITIVQYVTELHFSEAETDLALNFSKDLDIEYVPENAVNKTVMWTSSDESIVSVDQNGHITATGLGSAVITARTSEHSVETTILVTTRIVDVEAVHIISSADTVKHGESITMQAVIEPSDATYQSVRWLSSDEAIAAVDENGVVTGIGEGTVTISAVSEHSGIVGEKTIEVLFTHLESIQFSEEQLTLYIDETKQLSVIYEPVYATQKRVSYYSADPEIAEVTEEGQIVPVNCGTTTVTAVAEDGGLIAEITVNVWARVSGIEIAETEIALAVPEKAVLTASVLPAEAGNQKINWTSENEDIVTVDENGIITAVGEGETIVKAITEDGGYEAQCKVITHLIPARKIDIIADFESILYGESALLTAEVYPANASVKDIIWSSDDPGIIYVDNNGTITAMAEGSTAITASLADGSVQERKWIDVVFNHVESIELSEDIIGLIAGETYDLHPVILPENAMDPRLIYSSSDETIAYVDEEGVIHSVSEGNTVITIESLDSHITIERRVSVLSSNHVTNDYQVMFDGNGSTAGAMKPIDCTAGVAFTLPENQFKKENYVFSYWNTAADGSGKKYSAGENVINLFLGNSDPVILYAQWDTPNYSITYELNGGINSDLNPAMYKASDSLLFEMPSKTGYTFKGWYSDPKFKKKITGINEGSTKDITVYAKWTRNTYSVIYKLNGGKNAKNPVTKYNVDSPVITLKNPTRKGYEFAGWYTDEFFLSRKVDMIPTGSTGSLTLYAKWVIIDYGLTYVLSDGVNDSNNPQTYTVSDTVSLKAASKHGYVFKGWYSDPKYKKKVSAIKKGSTGDKTLYAKWQVNQYTITFNANGGKGKAPKKMSCKYFTEYTLRKNTFSKKGYAFISWNTEKDGSGRSFADSDQIINLSDINGGKIDLYAQWDIADYPINYYLNGGINAENNPLSYTMMSPTITLETPIRAGYIFKGWFSDSKFKNKLTGIKTGSTGAKNVYAKWGIETYTIRYVTDDGTTTNPDSYTVEDTIVFSDPNRTGYHFIGWYADAQYMIPVTGIDKGTIGDRTYYAKWEANTYYIVFDANGGSGNVPDRITAKYDELVLLPESTLSFGNYIFGGWNLTKYGTHTNYMPGEYCSKLTPRDGNTVTLYANWKIPTPAISSIKATKNVSASLNFQVEGAVSYIEIYRSTSSDGEYEIVNITDTLTSYSDNSTSLKSGNTYYYKIRAVYQDNTGRTFYSNYSSAVSVRLLKKPDFTGYITYTTSSYSSSISLIINNKGDDTLTFNIYSVNFYPYSGAIPTGCGSYGLVVAKFDPKTNQKVNIRLETARLAQSSAYIVIPFEYDGAQYVAEINGKKVVRIR